MKNIDNIKTKKAIVFDDGEETLTIIENETKVKVILDKSEFGSDNILEGLVTFIEVEDGGTILLEYVKEIVINS